VLCKKETNEIVCDECVNTTLKDKILCLEARKSNKKVKITGKYEIVDESDFIRKLPLREKTKSQRSCFIDENIFGKIDWKSE
jgi:hypothetical protein